jgi:hypothetical protein
MLGAFADFETNLANAVYAGKDRRTSTEVVECARGCTASGAPRPSSTRERPGSVCRGWKSPVKLESLHRT